MTRLRATGCWDGPASDLEGVDMGGEERGPYLSPIDEWCAECHTGAYQHLPSCSQNPKRKPDEVEPPF